MQQHFICRTACRKTQLRQYYGSSFYKTAVPKDVYPLHHGASFYPLLVSFRLQITYRKVRNSQIHVNKLVGQVSINLLHHTKFITSLKVSHYCNQHNYRCTCCVEVVHLNKQLDLQVFLLLQLPYCVSVLLLMSGCKSATA